MSQHTSNFVKTILTISLYCCSSNASKREDRFCWRVSLQLIPMLKLDARYSCLFYSSKTGRMLSAYIYTSCWCTLSAARFERRRFLSYRFCLWRRISRASTQPSLQEDNTLNIDSEASTETASAILKENSKHNDNIRKLVVALHKVYPNTRSSWQNSDMDAIGLAKALKRLSFMAQTKVYLFWKKSD